MKMAMPFAIAESTIEPKSEMATMTAIATASSIAGRKIWSGHQPVTQCVMRSEAVYTRMT